jgi:hypothetical protein
MGFVSAATRAAWRLTACGVPVGLDSIFIVELFRVRYQGWYGKAKDKQNMPVLHGFGIAPAMVWF